DYYCLLWHNNVWVF
nr:immunoglobulin light chain junction region [Macaca mulatta]MOX11366.1 immunoglobulin light chain junction region [Macaca mulatta]MOX12357.1 immunoglobulin light chain junction region [Macaca mulatta]